MTEITYQCDGVGIAKRVSDISEDGVFIDTSVPSAVGTEIAMSFDVGGRSIEVYGRVVHSQPFIGMGVQFVSLPADVRNLIEEFVEQAAMAAVNG